MFFLSTMPTPVLNKPDFSAVFGGVLGSLPFDSENLVRALEMIAFPETVFEIIRKHSYHILEVRTVEYPNLNALYLDERFGRKVKSRPPKKKKTLPPSDVILKRLKKQIGTPYIWGGNISMGIPQLLQYYPPVKHLTELESISWTFKGLDCSGLLYEAVEGALPRNTQDLLFIGKSIPIHHLSWEGISRVLKPLDLLIWKGHVVIVYNKRFVIESNHKWGGVCITHLKKRLTHIRNIDQKLPADDPIHVLQNPDTFLVRRFIF